MLLYSAQSHLCCEEGSAWLDWILGKGSNQTVVGHWNSLPREMVMAPTLPEFKENLAHALGGTEWDSWGCPVQGRELYSMILP